MARFAVAVLISLCLACGNAAGPKQQIPDSRSDVAAPPARTATRIVYAHERHNLLDVYDLVENTGEVRSKTEPDAPREFGGSLFFCHTQSLYCMNSPLEIAVPRTFPFPPTWGTGDYRCRLLPSAGSSPGVVSAECRFRGDSATLFEYSRARGVLRYRRVCPDCDDGYYQLSSERGLFPGITVTVHY
jgi:hypothetical protein